MLSLGIFDTTAKLETAISYIRNKQCEGDGEMTGKHFPKQLETTKNIKMLFNYLNAIRQISIELEHAYHH